MSIFGFPHSHRELSFSYIYSKQFNLKLIKEKFWSKALLSRTAAFELALTAESICYSYSSYLFNQMCNKLQV